MIRKVLAATINYDHFQTGMMHALEGIFGEEQVEHFDYLENERMGGSHTEINENFLQACEDVRPDWIWLHLQDTNIITAQTLRLARTILPECVITHWTGDCRPTVSDYLASLCEATHLTFVSSIGQLPMFQAAGAKDPHYLQIGVDWDEDVLGLHGGNAWVPPFEVPDVVFCGNYYGDRFPGTKDREDAIQLLMENGINVGVIGGTWPEWAPSLGQCHVKDQAQVYRRCKIALAVNNFNDIERYYSDRLLIAMANCATVAYGFPGYADEFRDWRAALWYNRGDMSELLVHVRTLLDDDKRRAEVKERGRREVLSNHTWFNRFLDILPLVEKEQARLCG